MIFCSLSCFSGFTRKTLLVLLEEMVDKKFPIKTPAARITAKRHDLVAIKISDPTEKNLPSVGLIDIEDAETGKRFCIDTSDPALRIASLKYLATNGALERTVYNSLNLGLTKEEIEGLLADCTDREMRIKLTTFLGATILEGESLNVVGGPLEWMR